MNELAETNAKGRGNIPSRDFFYVGQALAENDIETTSQKLVSRLFVMRQGTAKSLMTKLGGIQADAIKDAISMGDIYIPNAPRTVKKKGRNEPLVDTGHTRDSVQVFITED